MNSLNRQQRADLAEAAQTITRLRAIKNDDWLSAEDAMQMRQIELRIRAEVEERFGTLGLAILFTEIHDSAHSPKAAAE